jgi:hypothetical protein
MTSIILIVFVSSFFPFMFASIMVNFHKWKYYKKVYDDLPNKKFIIWESADGNSFSSDEPYEKRFFSLKSKSYQLTERIYLHKDVMTYFDPYSLYWLLKFDRYFKYNPVTKTEEKRNQRIDQLLK